MEIGVHDGVQDSNTYILDRDFGWHGTCIDPQMFNMQERTCQQVRVALGSVPGEATFSIGGGLSGLSSKSTDPHQNAHAAKVQTFATTTVMVRRPEDVLREAGVPRVIDYLSLDVEGAELDILRVFPFDDYCVRNITVETNYQSAIAQQIHDLLTLKGYTFHRHNEYDDFYTKACDCLDPTESYA